MATNFENSGTISLTNGSRTVVGSGTSWLTNYDGTALNIGGLSFPVDTVDSASELTLVDPYTGQTASGLNYTLLPLQPHNYQLAKEVRQIIDIAGDLVDAKVGPVGPAGPKGAQGPSGKNGDAGFGAIVNLSEVAGQIAGSNGSYVLIPVNVGDPGITLTQDATVFLPGDKPTATAALYARARVVGGVSGLAITIGLANAPEPQPEVPTEPVDLSGSSTIYGSPGTIIPLGINLGGSKANFTVNTPEELPVMIERRVDIVTPTSSTWTLGGSGAPYAAVGNAVSNTAGLNKSGTGFGFRNGHVVVNQGSYLFSEALAMEFKTSTNDIITQTPPTLRMSWKGIVPASTFEAPILNLLDYGTGGMTLRIHWEGSTLQLQLHRNGSSENIISPEATNRVLGTNQLYEAEWNDNPGGEGGTVTFYIDGVQLGAPVKTSSKPRVAPAAVMEINASAGNTSQGINDLEIESVKLSVGKPGIKSNYEAVKDGVISVTDLQNLVVDARNISGNQTARHLTYTANGLQTYDVEIVVGEMQLPAGRAYKAVLEDWSSGSAVEHPNHLVMTKPSAQNCKFEDASLYGSQATWTEVLPQGPVPSINGINYYCEGIRIGTYVQFQFGYDWNTATMPNAPFGDPSGKDSYMVPHKWKILDSTGAVIARVEKPNGEPLNATSSPATWQGTYDGRGVAQITAANPFYPHGTTRSGVIWRSHDPVEYTQQQIWSTVPVYDFRVPFASKTGFSVNGGDMRIFSDGQANGFANYRVMSWEPTTYQDIQAQAAATKDPWKGSVYNPDGAVPNAGVWLKYTPFNQMGRSPITGPGGVRDDRQVMPEMVALYARDVTSKRPHDARPMKQIALDYLTGYVSDPYHAFENGRNKPLYKGNMRRNITMRNHYYGPGQAATPASQAYYVQGGRPYEWSNGSSPLRVRVPYGGIVASKPIFGTNQIDEAHGHQLPHWGSLLFQTPEFAFLGHRFFDQVKLYDNVILGKTDSCTEFYERGAAWKFLQSAMAWKTASANSDRLYSRAEVMDFVTFDFETFYDLWYASTPGFLNPPTNIMTGGQVDQQKAVFAGAARFGPVQFTDAGVHCHDFFSGYWLSALHVAHRIGFLEALRAASPKVKAVVDWLLACHRNRMIGRINDGYLINAYQGTDYLTSYWTEAEIKAAGGDVSKLHQNMAQVAAARPAPSWDTYKNGNETSSRDGQAMDQLLAGPALLKDMGMTGADVDKAVTTAEQRFQEKLTSETAKGSTAAGFDWFKYHQATNNRPVRP